MSKNQKLEKKQGSTHGQKPSRRWSAPVRRPKRRKPPLRNKDGRFATVASPEAPAPAAPTEASAIPSTVVIDGRVFTVTAKRLDTLAASPRHVAPVEVVMPGVAAAGRVTLLHAREKLGKSTLLAWLCAAISRGGECWNLVLEPKRVLWVGLEEAPDDAVRRFLGMEAAAGRIALVDRIDPSLNVRQLHAEIVATGAQVVVIDSLSVFANCDDENGQGNWTRLLNEVRDVARATNAAIVFIHHARKSEGGGYRGSTAIGAGVDMLVGLSEGENDPNVRVLTPKGRWPMKPLAARYDEDRAVFELVEVPKTEKKGKALTVEELTVKILTWVRDNPGAGKTAVRDGVGGNGLACDAALAVLLKDGRVEYRGRKGGCWVVERQAVAERPDPEVAAA